MTHTIFSGYLTKDVEFKSNEKTGEIAEFTIAVQRPHTDKTDFWNCVCYGSHVAFIKKGFFEKNCYRKGCFVEVEGHMQQDSYEVKGQKRNSVKLLVSTSYSQYLNEKNQGGYASGSGYNNGQQGGYSQPQGNGYGNGQASGNGYGNSQNGYTPGGYGNGQGGYAPNGGYGNNQGGYAPNGGYGNNQGGYAPNGGYGGPNPNGNQNGYAPNNGYTGGQQPGGYKPGGYNAPNR